MKARMKNSISYFLFAVALSAMLISGCNNSAPKPTPDPLAGWHYYDRTKVSELITDDYQDYIKKLPPKQKGYTGDISFFEDSTGQHAVSIQIFEGNQNASWQHVRIYDKDNKRINVIRYGYIKYQS